MHWYLVHTKPRQEKSALTNLENQGYDCYLPLLVAEKLRRGSLAHVEEALFPRYLFIRLGQEDSSKSWSPIRSTRGVSRLVGFGNDPARVDDELVEHLKLRERVANQSIEPLFKAGERVTVTTGPFAGIEGVFQMLDGDQRAMVLIELLSKRTPLRASPAHLRKVL